MPTPFLDHALELVRGAESSVRELLARAAEVGDYDSLEKIAGIARELQKIGSDTNSSNSCNRIPISTGASSYPSFSRSGESSTMARLRMVGWSKKKNGEYKHAAPKMVLTLVVETLEQTCPGSGGEPLPMDELLQDIVHPETGRQFPEYYTRTCLRWLRKLGLVKRYGHSGYGFTAKVGDDPGPIVEAHWKRLPVDG